MGIFSGIGVLLLLSRGVLTNGVARGKQVAGDISRGNAKHANLVRGSEARQKQGSTGFIIGGGQCSTTDAPTQCGVDCSSPPANDNNLDVLIIGAGLAGLGAARELELANKASPDSEKKKFLIMESWDRVGGRMIAAHWITGGGAVDSKHPIINLGNCISTNRVSFDITSSMHFYRLDGTEYANSDETLARDTMAWDDAYQCLGDTSLNKIHNYGQDLSAQETLSGTCRWDTEEFASSDADSAALRRNLEWVGVDFEFAQRSWAPSTSEGFPENSLKDFGSSDALYINDIRGSNELAAQEFKKHGICDKVCLKRKVTAVDWNHSPILVTTVDANDPSNSTKQKIFHAKHVISTVSSAVLDHELISFNPALSSSEANNKLQNMREVWNMSLYYEIAFQFGSPAPFWPTDREYMSINLEENLLGRCGEFQVMDYHYNGSNSLICTVTTEVINSFTSLDQDAVNQLLHDSLGKVFSADLSNYGDCTPCFPPSCSYREAPGDLGVNECRYTLFQSKNNERWKGSYPLWRIGGTYKQFANYITPLRNSVRSSGKSFLMFAGDSTCYWYWSFMHGALYSGIRAGAQILKALGVKVPYRPRTPYFCEKRAPYAG